MKINIKTNTHTDSDELKLIWMIILAFLVGVIGGFGSLIFRGMIGLFHNLFFYAKLDVFYNTDLHTPPSIWGIGIILIPVIGSVLVTWLTTTFAPEARGHGVPEVMDAIYYRDGKIRPIVVLVKALASSVSIGTGGSVGREGPIIQIGAAFGSTLGQIVKMPSRQRIILIAAGAAAGIASTFNAPIGGLAFAIELMLVSVSAFSVALVAIATVTATIIGRIFLGMAPSFNIPDLAMKGLVPVHMSTMLLMLPFGVLIGLAATLFIHSIYWSEDKFEEMFKNPYIRHALGMFILGIIMYLFIRFTGQYYIDGVGYSTIIDILKAVLSNPLLLFLLFVGKLVATSLTLGSGASGGVFSPSLFLGASLGALFGKICVFILPGMGIDPVIFAIAGMAGMVSGSTGAVITAITMTFEQTRDYHAILPIMLSASFAYAIRAKLCPESIYTLKLFRRGQKLPLGLQASISSTKCANNFMTKDFIVIPREKQKEWLHAHDPVQRPKYVLVEEEGYITGLIREDLQYLLLDSNEEELISNKFATVLYCATWPVVLRTMNTAEVDIILVSKKKGSTNVNDVIGIITPREIIANAQKSAALMMS